MTNKEFIDDILRASAIMTEGFKFKEVQEMNDYVTLLLELHYDDKYAVMACEEVVNKFLNKLENIPLSNRICQN